MVTKIGFLQDLCIKHGDFKIAKATGNFWSKHLSVLYCWENELWDFMESANNRQIFPSEVVLDIDGENIEERHKKIHEQLDDWNLKYSCWKSGGRGIHIHTTIPKIMLFDKEKRREIKIYTIEKLGCEVQKWSSNVMIALENSHHRHTGNLKTLIHSNEVTI